MTLEVTMTNYKKLLCRVRLINWHYFENETISLNGSTLISGENTAGKSTILDAIQLVLTTNTRKFNVAANEKGDRDLKGYVRCKIGEIGKTYLRKHAVIANVALEFYEEKSRRYFVLGVHMTSPDEESEVKTRWYVEECRLEELSFLNGTRPALAEEFKQAGKKINYIHQKNQAKDRFKRRMGNLEDKFFDIIPKSLAFKPMDNVKDFINKFVLSEEKIDIEGLKTNIATLSELEAIMDKGKRELALLTSVTEKYEEIKGKDREILVNEFLLEQAEIDAIQEEIKKLQESVRQNSQFAKSNQEQIDSKKKQVEDLEGEILALNMSLRDSEATKLVTVLEERVKGLRSEINQRKAEQKLLEQQMKSLKTFLRYLQGLDYDVITEAEVDVLAGAFPLEKKWGALQKLEEFQQGTIGVLRKKEAEIELQLEKLDTEIEGLQNRLRDLEHRKLKYPQYTWHLKTAIEKEFAKRKIESKVYILSELLEITDEIWRNAIEGYLSGQKFYLIVEPEYYQIALEVYYKNRESIHSAGIVNTKKLELGRKINNQSLAYVIHSDNRYAKAYAGFVLGRVIRCETIYDLEQHNIAITSDCMLYQGLVVRKIKPEEYKNPFIGQHAYREQIINTKGELEITSQKRKELRESLTGYFQVLQAEKSVNVELIKIYMDSPLKIAEGEGELNRAEAELSIAQEDPTLIQLTLKLEHVQTKRRVVEQERNDLIKENGRLESKREDNQKTCNEKEQQIKVKKEVFEGKTDENAAAFAEAKEKYEINLRAKSPQVILTNFSPQRSQLLNEKESLIHGSEKKEGLYQLQNQYNNLAIQDFVLGLPGINEYYGAKQKLEAVELVKYEDRLKKAKEDCEQVFRSEFLSKMKENIESAKKEFRDLNKALRNIYYGDDSYFFRITHDKKKESLYKMITADNNQEGYNLWSQAFEMEYKEEMEDLFLKLTVQDDSGKSVIEEYTDYRSYLDYDIEIEKRDGSRQKFSDVYGVKSGSETQIPYYVAIAASFYQLYRYGDSVRVMLLDEAFDKLDGERIPPMMEFFQSLELQVILVTPPEKIEIIGENIDTVLTAIRTGKVSIIEEYDF